MDGRSTGEGSLKVRLLSVGKERADPLAAAVRDYAQRLSHYARFELIEVKASQRKLADDAKNEEALAMLGKLAEPDWLIALDERGEMLSSPQLASLLERAQNHSRNLLFVIGGDQGLATKVLDRAEVTLSLSRLTLSHRLARLVLIEQLYRGFSFLRGEPYAK